MQQRVDGFNGYFSFLRTEHPCKVYLDGQIYNSVAHAYEAAKTKDETERRRIRKAPTYKEMLQVARLVQEPENWAKEKLQVMERLLRDKFRRDPELRERLTQTGDRELVNLLQNDVRFGGGHTGREQAERLFWGQIDGLNASKGEKRGENNLGKLLEQVRSSCL